MTGKNIIVLGDGHFHLYPCFDLARAISTLIQNVDSLIEFAHRNVKGAAVIARKRASYMGTDVGRPLAADSCRPWQPNLTGISVTDQKHEICRFAFLAESEKYDYFHQILANKSIPAANDLKVEAGPEEHCLTISGSDGQELCLVAGRQIVTKEKLEVLGLGMEGKISDGLSAEEIIEKILAAHGLPVLPFSPGKWLFKRGQIALKLSERYCHALLIGDSALRPLGWPEPELMRRAGGKFLSGSDPLPLPGEEKYAGCYGFVYQGPFDTARPLTSIKQIIEETPQAIMPAGRRCSPVNVAGRLLRLRRSK